MRSACFVINNYSDEEIQVYRDFADRCKGLVGYFEVGESGTPHIQGYGEFKSQMTFLRLKKWFPRADIRERLGTPEQAWKYCMKGEQTHEEWEYYRDNHGGGWHGPNWGLNAQELITHGTYSEQGKRTEIHAAVDIIRNGGTIADVIECHPGVAVKYARGIEMVYNEMAVPRDLGRCPEIIVRWGESGVGKTYSAKHEDWPDECSYKWSPGTVGKWWNMYKGELKVHIEEFRGSIKFSTLLDLLDGYEFKVETKGGMMQCMAEKFVICSPVHPHNWYPNLAASQEGSYKQLYRRIFESGKIIHMVKDDYKLAEGEKLVETCVEDVKSNMAIVPKLYGGPERSEPVQGCAGFYGGMTYAM